MSEERNAVRFRQAAALLPPHLRRPVERLDGTSQARVEELRLRAGRPLTLVCPEGERTVPGAEAPVRSMDLSLVLEIATQASAHTALERVRNGFFTVRGGHRIGICGSGVVRDGEVRNLRQLSSLAIRVAREVPGALRGGPGQAVEWGACSRAHCSSRRRRRKDHPAAGSDPCRLRRGGRPRPPCGGGGRAG